MPDARSRMRCESRPKIGQSTVSGAVRSCPSVSDAGGLDPFAQLSSEAGQAAHESGSSTACRLPAVDHGEPVGLLEVGGDLRHQLVRRHAHRGRELRAGADLSLDAARDADRVTLERETRGDVEKGLVQRQAFDHRRVFVKYREDLVRHLAVHRHARPDADGMRTAAQRFADRHGRAHAELAHFVARRRDHAAVAGAADDDRLAAQFGPVALFHGRVERIHVDMQDGARCGHGALLQRPALLYFSTMMVIFFEITAGSCGMCSKSPNTSCSVCLPGGRVSVVSVWPLPK